MLTWPIHDYMAGVGQPKGRSVFNFLRKVLYQFIDVEVVKGLNDLRTRNPESCARDSRTHLRLCFHAPLQFYSDLVQV